MWTVMLTPLVYMYLYCCIHVHVCIVIMFTLWGGVYLCWNSGSCGYVTMFVYIFNIQDVGHVLKQMSLCLDKEFKPVPCPGAGSEMSDCGDFLYVPFDNRYTKSSL